MSGHTLSPKYYVGGALCKSPLKGAMYLPFSQNTIYPRRVRRIVQFFIAFLYIIVSKPHRSKIFTYYKKLYCIEICTHMLVMGLEPRVLNMLSMWSASEVHPRPMYCNFWGMLGIKPRALHIVNMCSCTELHPYPYNFYLFILTAISS
jgi:hypothetical protein